MILKISSLKIKFLTIFHKEKKNFFPLQNYKFNNKDYFIIKNNKYKNIYNNQENYTVLTA